MMSRKELESLIGPLTDEEWAANLKIFDELQEREWDEAHPMDE